MATVRIPLTQGKYALIDEEDYALIGQYKWFADKGTHTYYAGRNARRVDGSRTKIKMHRAIMDAPDGIEVDHANGDGLDNRRCNLRLATHSQNVANGRTRVTNQSGCHGVHWHQQHQKWYASVRAGREIFLGLFDDLHEAALTYDAAARHYHGAFAHLNFPAETIPYDPTPRVINSLNKSGYRGVSWAKRQGKWQAQIGIGQKKLGLGYFASAKEAADAYDAAAIEAFGARARTNAGRIVSHVEP